MNSIRLEQLIRERLGMEVAQLGTPVWEQALRTAATAVGRQPDQGWVDLVLSDATALQHLIEAIVVPETWFFRYLAAFDALAEHARNWRQAGSPGTYRVLSCPCSTGEEPWSIAMTLEQTGLPLERFRVDAWDISERVISIARQGLYSDSSFRDASVLRRADQFEQTTAGWRVHDRFRSLVEFTPHNLLDPSLSRPLRTYQAIFCRNLLIYLNPQSRRTVLSTLQALLAPGGVLFLGHSEPYSVIDRAIWEPWSIEGFAYRVRDSTTRQSPPLSRPKAPVAAAGQLPLAAAAPATSPGVPSLGSRPMVSTASTIPIPAGSPESSESSDAAERISALLNAGRVREALAAIDDALGHDSMNPELYLLRGTAFQGLSDWAASQTAFERVLYLNPGSTEALLQLKLLAQRRGDRSATENWQRRIERATPSDT